MTEIRAGPLTRARPEDGQRSRRFFVTGSGTSRRPVDVAIATVGGVIVVLSTMAASHGVGRLDSAVRRVAADLPGWTTALFDAAYALGALLAAAAAVLALVEVRHRPRLPLTLVVAVAVAGVGTLLCSLVVGAGSGESSTPGSFPVVSVAATTAVLLALRPWLVLTYRRLAVTLVAVQCVAAWSIGSGGPTDVSGALGLGMVAAGVALVALGSPAGHPDVDRVRRTLAEIGVAVDALALSDVQTWGVRLLRAESAESGPLVVKVYGRDAADAHRAARWWRTLFYRDQSAPGSTRLQLVEHEALITVLAERAGVPVQPVLAAVETEGDAVLVLGGAPRRLADDGGVDDVAADHSALREVWAVIDRLHRAGLVHGRLTLDHVGLAPDGSVVLTDFADGRIAAAPSERARDVATLLAAQAVRVGPDAATEAALHDLGSDAVAAALPYLQRAALPRPLRSADGVKAALAALTAGIAERTGVAPPAPAPIVRVTLVDLLKTVLILVAASALLTTFAGLDWATVFQTWQHAAWAWVVLGLVVAQTTPVADAVSTMSVVTTRLPLFPVVQLQYGIKCVGLAVSATAGRAALNTAFLRRFGEGPATAVTATALDSFAGAVANVTIVLLGLLLADHRPTIDLTGPDDLSRILWLLVVAVVVSCLVVALVPRLRRRLALAARRSWESLHVVTDSPGRALLLFGSNFASLLLTAVALACMTRGLHPGPDFGQIVFVAGAAALVGSMVPIPGNVGVGEAALTAGLVAFGVPSGPAFAIAVTQRIATSYLPPMYGAWALRWLRREDYLG